tara:strand:+ start:3580 stop:4290 length:711 start_codon:yes stop_codon:yes gene_type:complete
MKDSLTIAVPLYNEEDGVLNLYEVLAPIVEKLRLSRMVEILLVNDGSTDNTKDLLVKYFSNLPNLKIINHKNNLNLGGFLNTTIKNCNTELVVFLDSDCTFHPKYIFEMLELMDSDLDIVNGSPYHPGGKIDGVNKIRLLISYSCNLIYRKITKVEAYTFTSIFKMYRLKAIKNIQIENKGFVSVAELFIKSAQQGASVKEFPCTLSIRQLGESKIRIVSSIIDHLKLIVQLLRKL